MIPEIYIYEDHPMNQVIIGTRGVSEYKMDLQLFKRECLRRRIDRMDDRYKMFKAMLSVVIENNQYVDFEEVKPEIKLLNDTF